MELDGFVNIAKSAVKKANKFLNNMQCSSRVLQEYHFKIDGSIQTSADKRADKIIRAELTKGYPMIPYLSEENDFNDRPKGYYWVCDPVDGTTNFVNGQPIWGISLALFYNLEILIGIVNLPKLGKEYLAIKGRGSFCNDCKVHVNNYQKIQFTDIFTYCSHQSNNFSSSIGANIRAFGSSAYNMSQCSHGFTIGGWEFGSHIWDIAAGIILVKEAGGVIYSVNDVSIDGALEEMGNNYSGLFPCIFAANEYAYQVMKQDQEKYKSISN